MSGEFRGPVSGSADGKGFAAFFALGHDLHRLISRHGTLHVTHKHDREIHSHGRHHSLDRKVIA